MKITRGLRAGFIVAAAVALSACESAAPDSGDSGGAGPVWAPGEEWRVAEDPRVTIGSLDGPEAIGAIAGSALLGDGRVVLADRADSQIRVYSAGGTRVAAFGRAGQGPGEFRQLGGVAAFAGEDSLLAFELGVPFSASRLSVFTPDGVFVRSVPAPTFDTPFYHGAQEDGSVLARASTSIEDLMRDPPPGVSREAIMYQRIATDGQQVGTFGPFPGGERVRQGEATGSVFFGRSTILAAGSRYLYVGDNDQFEIDVYDVDTGEVVRRIERPYEAVRVDPAVVERQRDEMRDALEAAAAAMLPVDFTAGMLSPEDTPARETLPAFSRIVEDAVGNVWVQHYRSVSSDPQTWSVFDREGVWLGEVGFPGELDVRAIGRDAMLVSTTDDLDVAYLHVYPLLK